jgi:catechol-2,3-dioxygenase
VATPRPRTFVFTFVLAVLSFLLSVNNVTAQAAKSTQAAPAPTASSAILRIDHVALHVKDLETSARFYKSVFDFDIVHKWKTTWMVGKGRMRLGLFQRPNAVPVDDPDKYFLLEHFAFLTTKDGLETYVARLKTLRISYEEDDSGIAKSVFIKDPDGIQVEVTYYYAEAPPVR